MIYSITTQNFQSLANKATLDFAINGRTAQRNGGYIVTNNGDKLTLAQAIIGGNASGKTTMLKALALIRWIFTDSFRWDPDEIPVTGFAGSKRTRNAASVIDVVFELNGVINEYSVKASRKRILSESLTIRTLSKKRTTSKTVFTRTWNIKKKCYVINDSVFKFREDYWTSNELRGTSVITAAAKFGNEKATEIVGYWRKMRTNIDVDDRFMPYRYRAYRALNHYQNDVSLRERAEADVRKYDLGIQSFGERGMILHKHGDTTFELEINEESSGTQQFIALKENIDYVLENGGVALIDELNAYLHPMMVEAIINKFLDPSINTGKGQFIFSTHDLQVFRQLDPSQISLAEKDDMGITSVKRFDSQPRLRPADDYIKRYLAGQYGGRQRFNN